MKTTTHQIANLFNRTMKPDQLADILNAMLGVQDEEWATEDDVELSQSLMVSITHHCPAAGPIARGNVLCPGCKGEKQVTTAKNGTFDCIVCDGMGEISPETAQHFGIFPEHATR